MKPEPTRRELLAGVATAAGAAATAGAGVPPAAAQQSGRWPTFGYDLTNTGHNPDATGVVGDPGPAWGIQTGAEVRASAAVADGRVYVGSGDNLVYALDQSDGTERWTVTTDAPVRSTPAVDGGRVYVGSDDETVYAIDSETGEPAWTFEADGRVRGSPTVADGRVHVGSDGGTVYAIDSETGDEVWAFEEPGAAVDTAPAVTTETDGTAAMVYVGSQDGRVYAIDAISGTREWVFETDSRSSIRSAPAVAGGSVYVGGGIDEQVYALAADSGEERWRFDTGGSTVTSPAVADGRVYVASRAGGASTLYALDTDGDEAWTFEGDLELTAPAVADGRVYVGSRSGTVHAVDTAGEEVWSFAADGPVQSSPVVVGDRAYVGSDAGTVYALTEGGDATVGDGTTDTGDGPGGDDGTGGDRIDFLLLPALVVMVVAAVSGSLYAAHRAGLFGLIEEAADSVDPLFAASADEDDGDGDGDDAGDGDGDDAADDPTQVWELVLADVIARAEQTDRTATQDLLVTKYVDSGTLDSPVVAYELESYRDDPARVRIAEPRFEDGERDDAQPLGDGWHVEDDRLVFETTLDSGESRRTIVGRPDCPAERLDTLLDRPEITVEDAA